jgi:hypothetical protein
LIPELGGRGSDEGPALSEDSCEASLLVLKAVRRAGLDMLRVELAAGRRRSNGESSAWFLSSSSTSTSPFQLHFCLNNSLPRTVACAYGLCGSSSSWPRTRSSSSSASSSSAPPPLMSRPDLHPHRIFPSTRPHHEPDDRPPTPSSLSFLSPASIWSAAPPLDWKPAVQPARVVAAFGDARRHGNAKSTSPSPAPPGPLVPTIPTPQGSYKLIPLCRADSDPKNELRQRLHTRGSPEWDAVHQLWKGSLFLKNGGEARLEFVLVMAVKGGPSWSSGNTSSLLGGRQQTPRLSSIQGAPCRSAFRSLPCTIPRPGARSRIPR